MRRCILLVGFALACTTLARADYLFVKVDLGLVYQNIPGGGAGAGVGPGPVQPVAPVQPPILKGVPNPNPNVKGVGPEIPAIPPIPPGEGPYLYTCIELKSKPQFVGKKETGGAIKFDHAWGKAAHFVVLPQLSPNVIKYTLIHREPLSKEFEKSFKKELAAAGPKDGNKFVNAAAWALYHGLTKEFHATLADLKKIDPKHKVVANYQRVASALKKAPSADDPHLKPLIDDLSREQYHKVPSDSGFYLALTNLPSNFDGGVRRRANRLHETLENFYYWFALQEQLPQPPLPTHRLLLVITKSTDEFFAKHAQWGSPPFLGDGFTPRRDNFLLTSWRPTDPIYKILDTANQNEWQKQQIGKEFFISGAIWNPTTLKTRDPFSISLVQTLTVLQKAFEDDAEIATLSHEGTRQLLVASGILPRHVHIPEWIAQGLASYFETPPGAMHRGLGLPSWSNLIQFKQFRSSKKLDKPGETLSNVITDRYFRSAHKLYADFIDAPDKEKHAERMREEMEVARSSAWALVYYLIERRRSAHLLLNYCQELNTLPRDLDLDERALEACFAKVFDLGDARSPLRVDEAKLSALADEWFTEMAGISLENPELQNEYLQIRRASTKTP